VIEGRVAPGFAGRVSSFHVETCPSYTLPGEWEQIAQTAAFFEGLKTFSSLKIDNYLSFIMEVEPLLSGSLLGYVG
jgi:hypothetical protein